jgi:hypothetical protein
MRFELEPAFDPDSAIDTRTHRDETREPRQPLGCIRCGSSLHDWSNACPSPYAVIGRPESAELVALRARVAAARAARASQKVGGAPKR